MSHVWLQWAILRNYLITTYHKIKYNDEIALGNNLCESKSIKIFNKLFVYSYTAQMYHCILSEQNVTQTINVKRLPLSDQFKTHNAYAFKWYKGKLQNKYWLKATSMM